MPANAYKVIPSTLLKKTPVNYKGTQSARDRLMMQNNAFSLTYLNLKLDD